MVTPPSQVTRFTCWLCCLWQSHRTLVGKATSAARQTQHAGWKQKFVLLKEQTVHLANERLLRRADRTDFSDLMPALEARLKSRASGLKGNQNLMCRR
jgi:hypothetical protein